MTETREEVIASLRTRNGIKVGDKVIYVGPSQIYPRQNDLARARLKSGVMYDCTWIFPGEEFEQIELDGFEETWVHDMFMRVPIR